MPIGSYHAMGKPRNRGAGHFFLVCVTRATRPIVAHRAAQAEPGTISGRIWLQRPPVKMTKKRAASRSPLLDDPSLLGMSLTPIFAAKSVDRALWCGGAAEGESLGGSIPAVCKRRGRENGSREVLCVRGPLRLEARKLPLATEEVDPKTEHVKVSRLRYVASSP
jgi:hypothetical protein